MVDLGYPLSPRSERHPSVSVSIESAVSAFVSSEHSSPASGRSRRPRPSRRARIPPRNTQGQIFCNQHDCRNKNVTFRRPCEWNKHMDKHERPWKCHEPGCDANPGFTYSGGLLRHQREVHKMHLATRRPLYCPFPNCNRSSGTGFTRRENLEEHKRRRHLADVTPSLPADTSTSPPSMTPSITNENMLPPMRGKGRRDEARIEHEQGRNTGPEAKLADEENEHSSTCSSAKTNAHRLVQSLNKEIARKDAVIRQQNIEIARMRQSVRTQPLRHTPAATTA